MKYSIALIWVLVAGPALAQPAPVARVFTSTGAFVALSVPDLESSERWYSEKLGLRLVMRPPAQNGVQVVILEGGGLIVELIHSPDAVPLSTAAPTIQHTVNVHGIFKAGVVVEDYDRTLTTLRERGVAIVAGPFPARDRQRANFVIRDNAGNLLQFFGK